ncbi:hypothetical protein [Actinomadura macra]|uniref:hypothetical protein n=1 Tax=Actinomadura macra TaxID=46164 RepID=UPI000A864D70|nr:hypothetical protein [Actinomadura macra]
MHDVNITVGGHNSGSIHTGKGDVTQHLGSISVGPRQVTQEIGTHKSGIDDARLAVTRLLSEHYGILKEGAQAKDDLAEIGREIVSAHPNHDSVVNALTRLAHRVSANGALAIAVKDLAGELGVAFPQGDVSP